MNTQEEQRRVCERFGAAFVASPDSLKVGISPNVREGIVPLNGLRHIPEEDTTGWYIWAGEDLSQEPDFFQPLHVAHLIDWCPSVLRYLGLGPGWRFLVADGYEDVWFDQGILI
ncbi:hypothetical protein SOCE26_096260 [Sorangium cellulosum]|uniref:Imm33-like domain-containing protein n=1 Tax=Sorangium cellulosum TaxID=56 RepID=A0A2L0F935_SORCE|nr:hypothetical protein [Sorangium cellulosum]AUX48096.1 hypothetical protein SOCE26_096260 [Sorangium cellulosum]